jgi:hypothetical protein
VPALVGVLAVDLYVHRHDGMAKVFDTRGTVYIVLAGAALVAHRERQRLVDGLDRRFFRERYDAQRLLAALADKVAGARTFEAASALVAEQIQAALHPAFVGILVSHGRGAEFRRLAAAPKGEGPDTIPADGKMVRVAFDLGRPVEVREARTELLVPIARALPEAPHAGGEEWRALMALGPKRSEEPYAAEDRDLLQAAARSLGSLSRREAQPPAPGSRRFAECPACGGCFDEDLHACPADGSALVPSALPRLLLGRYRVERRLGRGGMGIVYAATDEALERGVAVKVLRDELAGDTRAAERFEREARLAARFSHPNVVTVHDFGVTAGRGILVMELLSGLSLRDELERRRPMEPRRVLDVLGPVCGAVEAAHRRGLVHRDLKPENIFLARLEGIETPKVLDFGISKATRMAAAGAPANAATSSVIVGTLEYMAPEQLRGEEPHASWDIWALAVIAHELLTGHRPIPFGFGPPGGGAEAAWPFVPADASPGDPKGRASTFLLGALSIDAARRPASALAFHDALKAALAGEA